MRSCLVGIKDKAKVILSGAVGSYFVVYLEGKGCKKIPTSQTFLITYVALYGSISLIGILIILVL